jgi:hypothetical protein
MRSLAAGPSWQRRGRSRSRTAGAMSAQATVGGTADSRELWMIWRGSISSPVALAFSISSAFMCPDDARSVAGLEQGERT